MSESNTASAVSALDKKLENFYEWTTQFIKLDELQLLSEHKSNKAAQYRLQQDFLSLQKSAANADIEFESITVFLKNSFSYSTRSSYSFPFSDYSSCIEYFQNEEIDFGRSYTSPTWLLCTVDYKEQSKQMLVYLRFLYQPGTLEKLGVVIFSVDEHWMNNLYRSFAPNAYIISEDGIIYSSSGSGLHTKI